MDTSTLPEQSFGLIADFVKQHALERPAHPAVIAGDRALDYGSFDRLADRAAAALQRDGVAKGGAVAICAAASIEYAVSFIGALRAGVAVAPLAPSSTPESMVAMTHDAGARILFLDAASAAELAPLMPGIGARVVRFDDGDAWNAWLAPAEAVPAPVVIEPALPFNIIYSSGTTGTPKGIVQSHGMRWAHVQRGTLVGYGPRAVTLLATPLYSNTTLVSFFPTLTLGGTVVLMPKFDARGYLELAQRHRATHTMLVPVQYQRLMALPEFDSYDLSAFIMKFCTSAPFAANLKADIVRRWPGGLTEYYGMTEGGGTLVLAAHDHPHKLHTVGQPGPGSDIRLIDDAGQEVAVGEMGEVVGHSPAMMNAYHKRPAKTAEAEWFDRDGKRFIRTGDVGRFDEDGFLTLFDRKKDMIISGGFNVYSAEVEQVLMQHPDVQDSAVVGLPDEKWGERVVAVLQLHAGRQVDAEEIKAFVKARIGSVKAPKQIEVWVDLPRSKVGKVLKKEVRATLIAAVT